MYGRNACVGYVGTGPAGPPICALKAPALCLVGIRRTGQS